MRSEKIRGSHGVNSATHGIFRATLPVNGIREVMHFLVFYMCVCVMSALLVVYKNIPTGVFPKDLWTVIQYHL